MIRIYALTSGAIPPKPFEKDSDFLEHWRKQSFVLGAPDEWRRRVATATQESTDVPIDPTTPESFCRSLAKAGMIEVTPAYAPETAS